MDKIWDRNRSKLEVIGRCGVDEKRMTMQDRQKLKTGFQSFIVSQRLKRTVL